MSLLASLLVYELKERLKRKGLKVEWKDAVRDLLAVREVEVVYGGRRHMLRLPLVGVAVPPPVREGPWCQDRCPCVIVLFRA